MIKNLIGGIAVGIANVIPGVSGLRYFKERKCSS